MSQKFGFFYGKYWLKPLPAPREKSLEPELSEQEQDQQKHTTLQEIGEGFKVPKRPYRSDDTVPGSEDFSNPPDPIKTNESGIPTSVPERTSRITELTADKTIQDFRNQEKVETDKESLPPRTNQTKPIGEKIRNGPGDKSSSGPTRIPSTKVDKRRKIKTCSRSQDPTYDPTDQNDFDLHDQSKTPEDLIIDQRKSPLWRSGAESSRMTYTNSHQQLSPLPQDKSKELQSNYGDEMSVDVGEEVTTTEHPAQKFSPKGVG
jgi:hypothetical protein